MNRSGLVVNHGGLVVAPRAVGVEVRSVPQDITYCDSGRISSFSLSTTSTKPPDLIPGMQELFTKFSSPPHPSPILAATLGGYSDGLDSYVNDLAATRTNSSCVTTPQSIYSDPVNSAEGQIKLENSYEASSSSGIDLADFTSNLMPDTLDEIHSLSCDPHADDLSNEDHSTIEEVNEKNCTLSLDDEDMDLVPNELVQFVSESTRRIRGEAVDGVSVGDTDLEEIDHDARLASLCLPILQPPSLVSSHMSDGVRPPSLSPHPPADCPFSADTSDDLNDIEFTRAYLSEPTDSHPALLESKEFEGYPSVPSLNEHNSDTDRSVSHSQNESPVARMATFDGTNVPVTVASSTCSIHNEVPFQQTEFDELVKSSPDSGVAESYFASPVFSKSFSPSSSVPHCFSSSIDQLQTESPRELSQAAGSSRTSFLGVNNCPLPSISSSDQLTHGLGLDPLANSIDAGQLDGTALSQSVVSADLFTNLLETKNAISAIHGVPTTTLASGSLESFGLTTDCSSSGVPTSAHRSQSDSEHHNSSPCSASKLPRTTNSHAESGHTLLSTVLLAPVGSNSVGNSNVSLENLLLSRDEPRLPSHLPCQSTGSPTQNSHNGNDTVFPPPATVQLISRDSVLTQSFSSMFAPTHQPFSFLLTTGANKPDSSFDPSMQTLNSSSNPFSSLGLPLQILQALPNLRPGMSILLNVKNDKTIGSAGSVPLTTASPTVATNGTLPKSDGTVFLFPNMSVPISDASRCSSSVGFNLPQIINPQRTCTLQSNLSTSVLLVPSVPSGINPVILSNSCSTIPSSDGSSATRLSNISPAATQFLLLRSTSKPDVKFTSPAQVPVGGSVNSEMAFLVSSNSSQKSQSKSPSFLLLPTATPSSLNTQPRLFSTSPNSFNNHSTNSNPTVIVDANPLPSWGCRPTDLQGLFSFTPGVGQTNVTLQNTLLAAALNRSVPNASTLSFPFTVLPNNPQTVILSPTSILQSSSTINTLLSTSLVSPSAPSASQTTSNIPVPLSLQLESNMKVPPASFPGHPSSAIQSPLISSTTFSTSGMAACVATTAVDTDNQPIAPVFESKKLIVLPSADKLLSSSRASLVSCTTPASEQTYKTQDLKFPPPASGSNHSQSPTIVPILNTSVMSSKSASPVHLIQSSTTSTASSRRRHQCPYCPKSCERKDNLQAHIRTHTGERPYPCRFCPKAFPQKDHLRAHIRTHTGEKPYRCPQCLKAFAQLGNLHRHDKTHRR